MDNPGLTQQFKAGLIFSLCLLFAIFLGWEIGTEDYASLVLGTVFILGLSLWFFTGRFFWVLTIASSFLAGTFPILRAAFTPFQILVLMGIAKFVAEDLIMHRTATKTISRLDLLMITGFMGILTYHAMHDRFGMRFLGSNVWGGHNYVNVYVGLIAFLVVQSIPVSQKVWAKLPYVVLAVTAFDLIISVITTIVPKSVYFIYPFYSAVSTGSLEEAVSGMADVTGRIGAFGSFGFTLIALILATVSLRQILSPTNFFRLLGVGVGFVAVLFSGFRSAVLNTMIGFLVAGIRDLKYGVLFLVSLLAALLFALSATNSAFVHLPKQVQRGLAFFPGNWDTDMARDAAASNDFRRQIWTLWERQYFPSQPWIGRGFGFKSDWSKPSIYLYRGATDYRQMVETGNIHNGFFAALDTFGIIGTIFFVAWNAVLLARAFRVSFRIKGPAATAVRFLALYLAVLITSYWIGAQTVGSFLPQEFAIAAVFFRLQHAIRSDAVRPLSAPAEPIPEQQLAPV